MQAVCPSKVTVNIPKQKKIFKTPSTKMFQEGIKSKKYSRLKSIGIKESNNPEKVKKGAV